MDQLKMSETLNIMIYCSSDNCVFKREDKTCRANVEDQKYLIKLLELKLFYDNNVNCIIKQQKS